MEVLEENSLDTFLKSYLKLMSLMWKIHIPAYAHIYNILFLKALGLCFHF